MWHEYDHRGGGICCKQTRMWDDLVMGGKRRRAVAVVVVAARVFSDVGILTRLRLCVVIPTCRYKREEILGRNCRFLQGPGTDRRAVKEIRSAIDNGQECTVRLINYTKTGQVRSLRSCLSAVDWWPSATTGAD